MAQMNTLSGGLVETLLSNDRFRGIMLYLHIDQSTNLNNGEGDAAIILTNNEVRDLIGMLNDFIIYTEGKPFVVIADPLLSPEVQILVDGKEVEKDPELVNPYLAIEDVVTPGEANIDYDNYFESIKVNLPKPESIKIETPKK